MYKYVTVQTEPQKEWGFGIIADTFMPGLIAPLFSRKIQQSKMALISGRHPV
jgi:hypothetical protein